MALMPVSEPALQLVLFDVALRAAWIWMVVAEELCQHAVAGAPAARC